MPLTSPKMKIASILLYVFLLAQSFFYASCTTSSGKSFFPDIPGYAEKDRKVYVLPKKLLEISGHVVNKNNQLVAINDEDGELMFFDFTAKSDDVRTVKFGKNADYEEIVRIDSTYVVMESNGDLHFMDANPDSVTQYKFPRDLEVEFESAVHYPSRNQLVLISKDHRFEDESIYAYGFDLSTRTFLDSPVFKIPLRGVFVHLKDFSAQCKPSAAAIHPVMNKLFILASVGKVLLQCSLDGKVEFAYQLNPGQFQQPEGISFASNGDMYISNEGLQGKATLIMFPYRK